MVKIFIGNLSQDTTSDELRSLFSQYGKIAECTILKNSGFVYMDNQAEAEEAIHNLHQYELNGQPMNVELSRGKSKGSAKLHISNIACTIQELRAKFEEFGTVIECDIVKNNATVRMERIEDAKEAIDKLNNATFKGKLMSIQLSTSRPHTAPGKRGHTGCFVCGKHGHWSKDCPFSCNDGYSDSTGGCSGWALPRGPPSYPKGTYGMASPPADYMSGPPYSQASHIGGLPPPPQRLSGYSSELEDGYRSRGAGSYVERPSVYDHDRLYSSVDYYEKYRARPYDSSYFEDRCMSYPPRPSLLKHPSSIDPSDCQPLRPPSSAMYYAQDCSLIRRVPVPSAGYAYERTQMSLLSPSRNSHASPHPKDHFASRYAPY